MNIGEVARRADIEASAIRYYERFGILPQPERVSGRRRYDDSVLDLLALVRFARSTGFTMREVRQLFGTGVSGGRISARWRTLASAKLAELEHQEQQARAARSLLERMLACRCVETVECGRAIRRAGAPDRRSRRASRASRSSSSN